MRTRQRNYFLLIPALTSALLFQTRLAKAQTDGALECDRLASSTYDTDRPAGIPGIPYDKLDATTAVAACEAATAKHSNDRRLIYNLARALQKAGRDDEAAIYYRMSADAGFALAQNNLATMIERGEGGLKVDKKAALDLYQQASDAGLPVATANLATKYESGEDVEQDKKKALELYKKAALAGYQVAQQSAARMYEAGDGLSSPDVEKAAVFWRMLAANADNEARAHLAQQIMEKKVKPKPGEPLTLLEPAALQKSRAALIILAMIYRDGNGVPKLPQKAFDYAQQAYDITVAADTSKEDGWLPLQREAGRLMLEIAGIAGVNSGDPSKLVVLREDFGAVLTRRQTLMVDCSGKTEKIDFIQWDWKRKYPPSDTQAEWFKNLRGCHFSEEQLQSLRDRYEEDLYRFADSSLSSKKDAVLESLKPGVRRLKIDAIDAFFNRLLQKQENRPASDIRNVLEDVHQAIWLGKDLKIRGNELEKLGVEYAGKYCALSDHFLSQAANAYLLAAKPQSKADRKTLESAACDVRIAVFDMDVSSAACDDVFAKITGKVRSRASKSKYAKMVARNLAECGLPSDKFSERRNDFEILWSVSEMLENIKSGNEYTEYRRFCMLGNIYDFMEIYYKNNGYIKSPSAIFCKNIIEHAANAQLSGADADNDLLVVYRDMAKQLGLSDDDESAQAILESYRQHVTAFAEIDKPVSFSFDSSHKLELSTQIALDAGFTYTFINQLKSNKFEEPRATEEQLMKPYVDACISGKDIGHPTCFKVGEELAKNFLYIRTR